MLVDTSERNYIKHIMFVPCTPEYLQEEVLNQYGIYVPLEVVIDFLNADKYITPEDLYYLVTGDI